MNIKSDFAILDVKAGRKALSRIMPSGSKRLPDMNRIPVTIHGFISHQWGGDDGVSIEFGIDVTDVQLKDQHGLKHMAKAATKPAPKLAPKAKGPPPKPVKKPK